jgi:hypothetical protein
MISLDRLSPYGRGRLSTFFNLRKVARFRI